MKKLIVAAVALSVVNVTSAQTISDILNTGQYNSSYGTARSAAMGGAFGSLGADAATLSINPAGLGMYRSSELSITPIVQVSKYESQSVLDGEIYRDNGTSTIFSLANLTGVINLYNAPRRSSSALTSLNLAIGYNRLNDYSSKQYAYSGYEDRSIGDMFSAQLDGMSSNDINSSDAYYDCAAEYWGALMAYDTGLLFEGGNNSYPLGYVNEQGNYVGSLATGDLVSPALYQEIRGNIAEYSFALGAGLWDRLYIGVNFAFQSFEYDQFTFYDELGDANNIGDLAELQYSQWTKYRGAAFSFKVGATAEVVDGWRVGLAVHAPSIYDIEMDYDASMQNFYYNDSGTYYQSTPLYLQDLTLNNPTRVIASTSYTLSKYAILSFDYERIWYGNQKVTDMPYNGSYASELNSMISSTFRTTNNYRFGLEARLLPMLSLRGGYSYYQSPYDGETDYGQVTNISGGIGFRSGNTFIDLAYVNIAQKMMPTKYYSDSYILDDDGSAFGSNSTIYADNTRHNILLTLGFRF